MQNNRVSAVRSCQCFDVKCSCSHLCVNVKVWMCLIALMWVWLSPEFAKMATSTFKDSIINSPRIYYLLCLLQKDRRYLLKHWQAYVTDSLHHNWSFLVSFPVILGKLIVDHIFFNMTVNKIQRKTVILRKRLLKSNHMLKVAHTFYFLAFVMFSYILTLMSWLHLRQSR